ncbi:MAG: type 1 glutamine amidotransferase [Desulfobacteraceae bacterium]|nr:type 1 glutamine amidotransferase [Desulfobacteraceae bacterium]
MITDPQISICIFNCHPKESRKKFDRSDVEHPHNLFRDFFHRYIPRASVDICFIADPGETLPSGANLSSYDGYIWAGSNLTIYHLDDPRVTRQIELAKAIYQAGVPCCGSCWGIQVAAVAAGGEVKKNPKGREWNIGRGIELTESGQKSSYLAGKPGKYGGFVMHLNEVTSLPTGAKLLASNEHSRVQALEVRHGKGVFWATQYHPEYNLYEMARLIKARAEPLVKEGFFSATDEVLAYTDKLIALHKQPDSSELRLELDIGEDILNPEIREQELRNWIDNQVLRRDTEFV